MIEIHGPSIEGRTTLVNPQRMSRAGERRSGDQFRDRFSSEAHTVRRSNRSNARPFSKNFGPRLRLEAPLDEGCRHLGHGRPPQFAGLAVGGGARVTAGGGGGGLTAGGGGAGRATAGGGRITAGGGGAGLAIAGGGGAGLAIAGGGGAGLIIAGGGGAGRVTTGGGDVTTGAGPLGLDTTGGGGGGRRICGCDGSDVG
jgi:hypothetical protein